LGKVDAGRILLGLVILALGGFLVLVNLQLSSHQILGLWPLFLIVPGVGLLSLAVILSPSRESKPLRPLHGDASLPDEMHHRGPLIW
jgi:hypothetical protein